MAAKKMRVKFVLGGEEFTSKKSARERISEILQSHERGDILEGQELEVVWSLFEMHDDYDNRSVGATGIIVDRAENSHPGVRRRETNCFHVIKSDGSQEDFSISSALNGSRAYVRSQSTQAMRDAISGQIRRYRNRYFGNKRTRPCEATGKMLSRGDSEVDHIIDFAILAKDFIEKYGDPVMVEVEGIAGGVLEEQWMREWKRYHRTHAQLRVVDAKWHRGRARVIGFSNGSPRYSQGHRE